MPIVTVAQTRQFLDTCKDNNWNVFASDAAAKRPGSRVKHFTAPLSRTPLTDRPCILIIGSEGQGLYRDVQSAAANIISIKGQREGEAGVDSLNVAVAAGILCQSFLRKPSTLKTYSTHKDHDGLELEDDEVEEGSGVRLGNRLF